MRSKYFTTYIWQESILIFVMQRNIVKKDLIKTKLERFRERQFKKFPQSKQMFHTSLLCRNAIIQRLLERNFENSIISHLMTSHS